MRKLKNIVASTLLVSVSLMAMTAKVTPPTKTVHSLLKGTTLNQISKTGVALNISYTTQHVNVGELSDVNLTITTPLTEGKLKVNLRGLNDAIVGINRSDIAFTLGQNKQSFPIHLQLSSATEGLHYLNVSATVEGQGTRVLAVPLKVGLVTNVMKNKINTVSSDGKVISVSSAQEEIK